MASIYALLLTAKLVSAAALFSNSSSAAATSSAPASGITAAPSSSGSCDTCTIQGGNVEVYWWPTASDGGQITTQIIDTVNNYTFNSPSIYIAFSTLYTDNPCTTGTTIKDTTIAFRQDELSTATGWKWNTEEYITRPPHLNSDFILATWVDNQLFTCSYTTTSFVQPADGPFENYTFSDLAALESTYSLYPISGTTYTPDLSSISTYTVSYNPCSPTLSAPTELYTIESGWSTCERAFSGLWDPPYALTPGASFGADTTTAASSTQAAQATTTTAAAVGSTPTQTLASATSTAAQETTTPQPVASQSSADSDPSSQSSTADPDSGSQAAGATSQNAQTGTSTTPYVVIGSQTITAGETATTVSGTLVSLQSDGSSIVVGSTTVAVTSLLASTTTSAAATLAIGSQTLAPGQAITVTGASGSTSVLSLDAEGSSVVVGGSTTVAVSQISGLTTAATSAKYVIGSQTLSAGAVVTLTGSSGTETVSVDQSGKSAVVDGTTVAVSQIAGVSTIAASSATPTYVLDGVTLTPGQAVTIGTRVVSLQFEGSSVVVGGSTIADSQVSGLSTASASSTGVGLIILSMGGYATATSTSGSAQRTGATSNSYNGTVFTGAAAPAQGLSSEHASLGLVFFLVAAVLV